jgi:hypothetical protein
MATLFRRMSLRLCCVLICGCVALAGCGGSDGQTPPPNDDAGVVMNPFHLVADPDSDVQVERGATAMFTFRYTDEAGAPIEDATVRFAILGHANDASLLTTQQVTDADGRVSGNIIGSSTETSFQIRATADMADAAFLNVSVSNAGFGSLEVEVTYTGTRPVVEYEMRLYSGLTCNALTSTTAPDRDERMRPSDSTLAFESLPAGVTYAVAIQGLDRDHILLANACKDGVTIVADDVQTTQVILEDTAAHGAGTYQLRFAFGSLAPGQRVYDQLRASSDSLYRDDGATYLLDQVDALITESEHPETLVQWQTARAAMYIDTAVASYLDAHETGPSFALEAVGALARDGIAHIAFNASLQVLENGDIARDALRFTAFDARSMGLTIPISMSLVPAPTSLSQGTYSTTRAALEITSFDFSLPLGSLARAYLESANSSEFRSIIIDAAQCEVLGEWWTDSEFNSDVSDAALIEAACSRAVESVADSALVAIANLDVSQRALHLEGTLSAHDDDHDGEIESIGESTLSGLWRRVGAMSGIASDMRVTGTRSGTRPASAIP